MIEKKNQLLNISLVLYAILTLGYGVIYLFFPEYQMQIAGGQPIATGWIRWIGGVLLALGGSILIYVNPVKQGIFVTSICIGSLLVGLTNFYELIFQCYDAYSLLDTLIPAIVLIILAILFWLSLRQLKKLW